MTYLYSPPTWRNIGMLEGSLRYGVTTSVGVWRIGGVWHSSTTGGLSNPDETQIDVDVTTGIKLFFGRPTLVPDSLVATLSNALNPSSIGGDPSWNPGTLVHQ